MVSHSGDLPPVPVSEGLGQNQCYSMVLNLTRKSRLVQGQHERGEESSLAQGVP